MDRELVLLNIIKEQPATSQRQLSKKLDVSLGTINNMISKMEENKVLQIEKESSRKVRYQITDIGEEYHNELYVRYISDCFETITSIRRKFKTRLQELVSLGKTHFYVYGTQDELRKLVKMCLIEISRKQNISYDFIDAKSLRAIETLESHKVIVGWAKGDETLINQTWIINLLK